MLTPGWYLPDTDWFAQLPDAPQLDADGQAVIAQLSALLGSDSPVGPAATVAATHALLLSVEHLGEAMTHATALHDLTELARLLCGLNLAQAHLTQTIQRIAANLIAREYPGSGETPAQRRRVLVDSLSTASANSEVLSGHLKEAHLVLRDLTQ